MLIGIVKWFNVEKGFGFIEQDGDGFDVFVYYLQINVQGYCQFEEGQWVLFEIQQGCKGIEVQNVIVIL